MIIDDAKKDRTVLKSYFVKNAIPTEGEFAQLIDSVINQREDGFAKPAGDPLSIEAAGDDTSFRKVLNLYQKFSDADPAWSVSLRPRSNPADPASGKAGFGINDGQGRSRLAIDAATGNVGVGTVAPTAKLEVAGAGGTNVDLVVSGRIRSSAAEGGLWVSTNRFVGGNGGDKLGLFNGDWRLVVQADGKVGVGTATPAETLHVAGRGQVGNALIGPWPANAVFAMFGASTLAHTDAGKYALIQDATGGAPGQTFLNSPVDLRFRIGNVDKMVVLNNGNVGVGCTDPGYVLDVANRMRVRPSGQNTAGIWFSTYYRGQHDAAFVGMATASEVGFWGSAGGRFHLTVDCQSGLLKVQGAAQKPGGGPWAGLSDERLKKNIRPLRAALDKLLALEGVTYEWRKPEEQGGLAGPQMGMIAQQVEKVFPEWISVGNDGYRVLGIRGFEALVVEAVRELHEKVEALSERCARYEALLAANHIPYLAAANGR